MSWRIGLAVAVSWGLLVGLSLAFGSFVDGERDDPALILDRALSVRLSADPSTLADPVDLGGPPCSLEQGRLVEEAMRSFQAIEEAAELEGDAGVRVTRTTFDSFVLASALARKSIGPDRLTVFADDVNDAWCLSGAEHITDDSTASE